MQYKQYKVDSTELNCTGQIPQHLQVLKLRMHVKDMAGHFVYVNLTLNVVNYSVILVEPVRKRMFESF